VVEAVVAQEEAQLRLRLAGVAVVGAQETVRRGLLGKDLLVEIPLLKHQEEEAEQALLLQMLRHKTQAQVVLAFLVLFRVLQSIIQVVVVAEQITARAQRAVWAAAAQGVTQ
jgi:hypothetical protein